MNPSVKPLQLRPNIYVLIVGLLVLAGLHTYLQQTRSEFDRIAQGLAGEIWFRISMEARHVGYMYNHAFRDALGQHHFVTTTHFLLADNSPNTITKHLTFAAGAPHRLLQATYENRSNRQPLTTHIELHDNGYQARLRGGYQARLRGGYQADRPVSLDWQFSMQDFLAFEHWLRTSPRASGDTFPVRSIDFEKLHITQRSYAVVERNSLGYLVESNSPFAATRTQLDQQMRPHRLEMQGVFNIAVSSKDAAVAVKQMQHKTSYTFALDQRLLDHQRLASLNMQVVNAPRRALPARLHLRANPAIGGVAPDKALGEELRIPLSHPQVQQLAQQVVTRRDAGGNSPALDALVTVVHRQLQYTENNPAGDVLTALSRGSGECTDFADLLTTVARAAGYPARTIYGLAYRDSSQPVFMFHAWNEVYADKAWHAVDPTWDQPVADATHIPLNDDQAAALMLAHNRQPVSFKVIDFAYQ